MAKKKRALVVDDEADVRAYLGALLEDIGFEVLMAEDGARGIEAARKERPDLITLDVSMPEQSGVRTYRQLKTDDSLKEIPVVIITGFSEKMSTYLKKLSGFPFPAGFVNKPIEPAELKKLIEEIMKT
ncbi:MAG: response regulator [Betaproteobacteria bacterium]|nr:response regulator [Betaproteobacteria bacterium]